MWIKAKYTFIKTVYSPRFYGGPYLQAKHADVCSGVLFWTACTRRPHVLSLPSSIGCEKSDSWRQTRSVKTAKKVMNGTTMWSCDTELCTNGVEATKCWVFVAHFSIYSTSRCRCHTGTDIPRLRGHTLQINQVVRTVRHRISCCAPTIHWKCDAQIQNRQIKSPPALWKDLTFQCLGVIVTLNGKSTSMLLEPTKNKLKQWRVIEKSVNKCNFFSQMFWIIIKWMKITEKQICEDQIVTFKLSHILLYQGLLFFNTINMCDRGRTITHMQIPRFHTQVWYNWLYATLLRITVDYWYFYGDIVKITKHVEIKSVSSRCTAVYGMIQYAPSISSHTQIIVIMVIVDYTEPTDNITMTSQWLRQRL